MLRDYERERRRDLLEYEEKKKKRDVQRPRAVDKLSIEKEACLSPPRDSINKYIEMMQEYEVERAQLIILRTENRNKTQQQLKRQRSDDKKLSCNNECVRAPRKKNKT